MENKKVVILFNDFDPVLPRVIRMKFQQDSNWETIVTNGFDEALKTFNDIKPDLLITDIILNDDKNRTGFDLIKTIRDSEDGKQTKIVVLSDLGEESDKQMAKQMGADFYFVKSQTSVADLIVQLKTIV
jgi:DNA-binding response OmpR family regulator